MTHGDPARGGRHGDVGLAIGRQGLDPIADFLDLTITEEKPFFLWYAPFLPHTPHNPPERLFEKYRGLHDSPHVARYWAMCEWFDETCGQLLDHLDERKIADNTIVLYVTDNGWINEERSSRYAPRSKRSQYEGGVRTPIMVRWPGHVEPRMDETHLASSIDLAPTILQAAGLPVPDVMPGIDLLDAKAVAGREAIFGEILEHDIQHMTDPVPSLRFRWIIAGDWKLIVPHLDREPDAPMELFNLTDDPHETKNVAVQNREVAGRLRKQLDAWWTPQATASR